MSDQTAPSPTSTIDPFKYLQIVLNADGTLTRLAKYPISPAVSDPNHSTVLSKDIPLTKSNDTWIRLYIPHQPPSSIKKLPLIIFFHGGGFIILSAATTKGHDFCVNMAQIIPAVIVSVEYRLAPEHRLPAAYDDALEAMQFIKTTDDEWLTTYADLNHCYLMGSSAGANIAYHAGLRAGVDDLKIQGMILLQPFFGGSERTESEMNMVNDPVLPLCASDLMWEFGLPLGVDRDHEYCNPMVSGGSQRIERMRLLGWRFLVTGCDGDPLIDRQMEFARMLEGRGVRVVSQFREGGYHGVDFFEPSKDKALCEIIKKFISPTLTD